MIMATIPSHPYARIGLWAAIGLLFCAAPARAFPGYFDALPNGATARTQGTNPCTMCHTVASPSTCAAAMTAPCLNVTFGLPFQANENAWSMALALADLDGDGFTNGQELQDPMGTWQVGATAPGIVAHVTAPFDATLSPGLHDADMDHVCWFGRDTDGDFLCTGAGEKSASDFDCQDDNAARHTGAAELCDAADQDCDGNIDEGLSDCDPGIGSCGAGQGQNREGDCFTRELIDGDRDGFCHVGQDLSDPADWDCADVGEQNGRNDCDEFDPEISPSASEACLDGVDNDCDGDVDAEDSACSDYADGDGDGFCPLGVDLDADGQCDTEEEAEAPGRDCDDDDAAFNPNATEDCTSGEDEDCDGLLDGRDESCTDYVDADGDGFCVAGRDENGDGFCDASGEPGPVGDCDDTRSNVFAGGPENCIDERDNDCDGDVDEEASCVRDKDEDGDGYCPLGRDLSVPLDGDCTDDGEDQNVSDCDDDDDEVKPGAVEACADRVDNDCDGLVDLADDDCNRVLDRDGDAYCPEGHDLNGDGDCLDFDEARPIRDCDDTDPEIRPRIGENCSDGIDNDCNDQVDGFDPVCGCTSHDDCPVSEPCMIGRCIEDVGCRAEPDLSCGEDDDGGAVDPGDGPGRPDAGDEDGGGGSSSNPPSQLEDVGCGCRIAGAPDSSRPALLLAFLALTIVRLRRRR
jgi:MYXO-CTERM domain-containing protein